MRIRVKLRELKDADVQFISLVKRGANRIPFRIVKSDKESDMINLSDIKLIFKGAKEESQKEQSQQVESVPTFEVKAIATFDPKNDEVLAAIHKAVKESGFEFDNFKKYDDGSVVFYADEIPEDGGLIRVSDYTVAIVKGAELPIEAAQGFYPGLSVAASALIESLTDSVMKAESTDNISEKINGELQKFSQYVSSLMKVLPSAVFKADKAIGEIMKSIEVEKAATPQPQPQPQPQPEDQMPQENDPVENQAETNESAMEALETMLMAKLTEVIGVLTERIDALNSALASVSGQVGAIAKSQQELSDKVAGIASEVQTVSKEMKSTVVVGAVTGDIPVKEQQVQKSESSKNPFSGCFDTAFIRRRGAMR